MTNSQAANWLRAHLEHLRRRRQARIRPLEEALEKAIRLLEGCSAGTDNEEAFKASTT